MSQTKVGRHCVFHRLDLLSQESEVLVGVESWTQGLAFSSSFFLWSSGLAKSKRWQLPTIGSHCAEGSWDSVKIRRKGRLQASKISLTTALWVLADKSLRRLVGHETNRRLS